MPKELADLNLENTKIKDEIKLNYCKTNNIKILYIKHTEFNIIENILNEYINTL